MDSPRHVVVLGAGVTGLTSAIFLAEAGYKVTVIAAHVPGDKSIEYTSPWAGAHWRTASTPREPMLCDWDVQTFQYWVEVLEREKQNSKMPKAGLKMQDSYHYWNSTPTEELWWAPHVQDFHQISTYQNPVLAINEAAPAGVGNITHAAACRAPSLDTSRYLLWLQENARALGAEVIKARLPTDKALPGALAAAETLAKDHGRGTVDCYLNATGIGAAKLCDDPALHPIKGQTVLVKGEAAATRTREGDGWTAYCIPRPGSGSTILGGTKEPHVWCEAPDEDVVKNILERNLWQVPELLTGPDGGFEVISAQAGLRPGRTGGPRMEKEIVAGRKVVHGYGHAGSGYQHSVGSARLVVKLVTESVGGSHVFARL